jgi:hypothetical protein
VPPLVGFCPLWALTADRMVTHYSKLTVSVSKLIFLQLLRERADGKAAFYLQ